MSENFISSNCYTCIELNAHALVKKVLVNENDEIDRNTLADKSFIPNLYGSQPCESTFRQVRSFSSTFSTVVNCNMLDIIHRVKKIQLQNDIIVNSKNEIKFPRFEKKLTNTANRSSNQECHRFESLNSVTIISLIEKARQAVISELKNLGIDTSKLNFHCQVKPVFEEDISENDSNSNLDSELDSDSEDMEFRQETVDSDQEVELDEDIQEDINLLSGNSSRNSFYFKYV